MPMVCDACWHARKHGWWGPKFRGTHCSGCHQTWSAQKQVHCRVCHESFSADSLAEKHRRDGRCLSREELAELRRKSGEPVMRRDERGVWRYADSLTRRKKVTA